MMITIMGSRWKIVERSNEEDKLLSECDGYCDWTTRQIIVRREFDEDLGNLNNMDEHVRKVMRHEIVHAFLFECGLAHASAPADAWAVNEEMVDWFAYKGQEIYEAWRAAGALSKAEEGRE